MKLKNTPWFCKEQPLSWSGYWMVVSCDNTPIANNIDQETARAIAALPETLAELERHKKLHQGMLDVQQELEAELERVKEELEVTTQALDQAVYRAVQAEKKRDALKDFAYEVCPLHRAEDLEQLLTPKE